MAVYDRDGNCMSMKEFVDAAGLNRGEPDDYKSVEVNGVLYPDKFSAGLKLLPNIDWLSVFSIRSCPGWSIDAGRD